MTRPITFVTRQIFPEAIQALEVFSDIRQWEQDSPPSPAVFHQRIQECAAFLTMLTDPIDSALLRSAPKSFKVISQMAVGYDNIDIQTASELGIPVGHTPGILTETTADMAWSLLMAVARRVVEAHNQVQNGIWKPWGPSVLCGQDIHAATLGIVGFGRIGQAMAKRAQGFEMRVLVSDPQPNPELAKKFNVEFTSLDELLQQSDFVSLHTYLSPQTRHLISRPQFEKMKPTAVLINTARGAVVDSQALEWALTSGRIAGAGLDVFDPEPIPSGSPLLHLANVVITPHIASASVQTRLKMALMCVENIRSGLEGKRLPFCANPQVYDRS